MTTHTQLTKEHPHFVVADSFGACFTDKLEHIRRKKITHVGSVTSLKASFTSAQAKQLATLSSFAGGG